jgi:glutathione S-transferase
MPAAQFIAASYSAWSERARWALDHHHVSYRETAYVPMLGTPWLRWKTGRWSGKLSVPVLVADGQVVHDSVEIARWADRAGAGGKLFVDGVDRWIDLSNRLLDCGRAVTLPRILASRQAGRDALPAWTPRFLHPLMDPMARMGTRYVAKKYDAAALEAEALATLRAGFGKLRQALGSSATLLPAFSFADITMAAALMFARPPRHPAIELGDGLREAYTVPELKHELADLFAWRDRLYAEHR